VCTAPEKAHRSRVSSRPDEIWAPQFRADKAIEEGSVESVVKLLTAAMQEHLREHFNEVVSAKAFMLDDVTAGRAYVKAYVEFIHYVERVYESSTTVTHGHFDEIETIGDRR
jgi:hypothetical protein